MKSIILNDLFNIGHNVKAMAFTMIFLAICVMPSSGTAGLSVTFSIICSMMTITTFSFDERSKWTKYALIMPITRKDYVVAKYVINLIFTFIGALSGVILALISNLTQSKGEIAQLLILFLTGISLGVFFGNLFIPLLIKFGTEKARIISISVVGVTFLTIYAIYKLIKLTGIKLTNNTCTSMTVAVLLIILVSTYFSFLISTSMMKKKEF